MLRKSQKVEKLTNTNQLLNGRNGRFTKTYVKEQCRKETTKIKSIL